jgi:hypothetical protein
MVDYHNFPIFVWPSMAIFRSDLPRLPAASGRPLGEALEAGEAKIQALREDF